MNQKIILDRQKVNIPSLSKELEGFNILHISDLNGDLSVAKSPRLNELLKGKSYDVVCFTGNMIGDNAEAFFTLVDELQKLGAKVPMFYLPGTSDPNALEISESKNSPFATFIENLALKGVRYLDRPFSMNRGKQKVYFMPEELYNFDAKATLNALTREVEKIDEHKESVDYKRLSYQSRIMEEILSTEKALTEKDIQIVLSSLPLNQNYLSGVIRETQSESLLQIKYAHLILSGTLVGGQWCLPGRQAIYVPEYGILPKKSDISGMNKILNVYQYISTGLSTSPIYHYPKFRIFNPPTITLLKLTNQYK